MVDLLAQRDGASAYVRYLPELERECAYWKSGADRVARGQAYRNVVRLPDGIVLSVVTENDDEPDKKTSVIL